MNRAFLTTALLLQIFQHQWPPQDPTPDDDTTCAQQKKKKTYENINYAHFCLSNKNKSQE